MWSAVCLVQRQLAEAFRRDDDGELTRPVHAKREPRALLVVFECDGEESASRHASGGEQACLFVVRLLIDYRAVRVGDRLAVREETDD